MNLHSSVKSIILLSNNPRFDDGESLRTLNEKLAEKMGVPCGAGADFSHGVLLGKVAGGHRDVLLAARDLVHSGYELLTHPVSSSVKPNENPFKSILLSRRVGADACFEYDLESLTLIESALSAGEKFSAIDTGRYRESTADEYALIDFTVLMSIF